MATQPTPAPPSGQPPRHPPADRPPSPLWRAVARINRAGVGWALVGAGLVAIFLGWFGVSGQALVAKQLPYLVSGGILGVALVSMGAFVLGTEDLRKDSGRLDRLERMVNELHAVLLARADAPDRSLLEDLDLTTAGNGAAGARSPAGGDQGSLVALPEGQTYHRASCAMVTGKAQAAALTAPAARRRGLKPCRLCEPAPVAG